MLHEAQLSAAMNVTRLHLAREISLLVVLQINYYVLYASHHDKNVKTPLD